jgi:hypothetical protein
MRPWGPLVGAALALAPARVHAEPVVHVSLESPGIGKVKPLLDAPLPSSETFTVELPVPGVSQPAASLAIWPQTGKVCAGPPDGGDQVHRIAMVVHGKDAEQVLRATVPPLQVDASYCFQIRYRRGVSPEQVASIAQLAASTVAWDNVYMPRLPVQLHVVQPEGEPAPPPKKKTPEEEAADTELCAVAPKPELLEPIFKRALKKAIFAETHVRQKTIDDVTPVVSHFLGSRICEKYGDADLAYWEAGEARKRAEAEATAARRGWRPTSGSTCTRCRSIARSGSTTWSGRGPSGSASGSRSRSG